MTTTIPADNIQAAPIGQLGLSPLPKLPSDLVALRSLGEKIAILATVEKDPAFAVTLRQVSERLRAKSERYIVLENEEENPMFGGRMWDDPKEAAEFAKAELKAENIASNGCYGTGWHVWDLGDADVSYGDYTVAEAYAVVRATVWEVEV